MIDPNTADVTARVLEMLGTCDVKMEENRVKKALDYLEKEQEADGSWFGSFYVENPDVWKSIKEGTYKGFSVEGMFDYNEPISAEENALIQIEKLLSELID